MLQATTWYRYNSAIPWSGGCGERDRKPNWSQCLAFCARQLPPPRRAIIDIAALDPSIAPPTAKAKTMLFAYQTRLALIRYRLALQFGGVSTRL